MTIRIKEILKEKRMTQQDLANLLKCSLQNVKQTLNKSSLTTETIEKIAAALDVPVWQLFASPAEVAQCVTKEDFIAIVRKNGILHTFDSERDLIEFVEHLKKNK